MRERCLQNYLLQKSMGSKKTKANRIKKQQNIMDEHNDPLQNAFSYNDQTRTMLASWNEERKLAIEVRDNLNKTTDMITTLEGKINQSAEQINELKKKNEKLKQGIKRKLASSFKTVHREMKEQIEKVMNEKIEKVQSELIEQIEKDVEEETDAGIV